jgi:hypothetical protein
MRASVPDSQVQIKHLFLVLPQRPLRHRLRTRER